MIRKAVTVAFLYLTAHCLAQDCSTPLTTPNSTFATLYGSFLQIYRTAQIKCDGKVQSWTFQCDDITLPQLPILSVWEQSVDESLSPRYRLVGSTVIRPESLQPLSQSKWYQYAVPPEEQFDVTSSRNQFIGAYYSQTSVLANIAAVSYLTPKAYIYLKPSLAATPSGSSTNGNLFKNWDNSTLVAYMSGAQMSSNLTATGGYLLTNTTYVDWDFRLPNIQASIVSPTTTTPTTTTTSKVTKRRTTKKTTTTSAPTTPPNVFCGHLPDIDNGKPSRKATGVVGEQIAYQCNEGYSSTGTVGFTCAANGTWTGNPVCLDVTCYLPLKVGTCGLDIAMWYYDRPSATCQPFYYSGCDGNANRFSSFFTCAQKCGRP